MAERAATGSSGRACVPAADGTCCLPTVLSVRLSSAFTVCTVPLSRSSVHHGEAACLESEFGVSETVWRRCPGARLGSRCPRPKLGAGGTRESGGFSAGTRRLGGLCRPRVPGPRVPQGKGRRFSTSTPRHWGLRAGGGRAHVRAAALTGAGAVSVPTLLGTAGHGRGAVTSRDPVGPAVR